MTRVLVTGARGWFAKKLATRIMARLVIKYGADNLTLVHGAADGIDAAFDVAAKTAGVAVEPHPAEWDNLDVPGALIRRNKAGKDYNANAGPRRNAVMIAVGADLVLACHKQISWSRGTRGCVALALQAGIPTYLIDSDDGEPKRLMEAP